MSKLKVAEALDLIEAQHEAHLERVECRHRGECPGCDERTDEAIALYYKLDGKA